MLTQPARPRRRARRVFAVAGLLVLVAFVATLVGLGRAGYGLYIVHTGSMTPTYDSGDLVIDRSGSRYGVGDVITFEHGSGPTDLVTHRIIKITEQGIQTKGDGNRSPDVWFIRPDQVHGVAVGNLPNLGYVMYFLKQPAGVGAVMMFALSMVLLWGMFFPEPTDDGAEEPLPTVPQQRTGDAENPAPAIEPDEAEGGGLLPLR